MKEIEKQLRDYYETNLANHGASAQGVGWKNEIAQQKRFKQLANLIIKKNNFSINDLGCGVGDFLPFLLERGYEPSSYIGYDVSETMLSYAEKKLGSFASVSFVKIETAKDLKEADYTMASGIFNLKYSVPAERWLNYILDTLESINEKSCRGFAFNMLTKYSDKELMLDHLYYGDPLFFFDHCKKNYARNIALLHDYDEYDFTITVKK